VKGKGKTERVVFLSADARNTLADYLEQERGRDVTSGQTALFLTAPSIAIRAPDGRLSLRAFNLIWSILDAGMMQSNVIRLDIFLHCALTICGIPLRSSLPE
jgi:site-specific recombinase XerD